MKKIRRKVQAPKRWDVWCWEPPLGAVVGRWVRSGANVGDEVAIALVAMLDRAGAESCATVPGAVPIRGPAGELAGAWVPSDGRMVAMAHNLVVRSRRPVS
jgi:hypothetical protein